MNVVKNKTDISIYASNRRKKIQTLTIQEQLRKYGYWNMVTDDFFPNCYLNINENDEYEFNGIIASHRQFNFKDKKDVMLFIGVEPRKYIQVNIVNAKYFTNKFIGIKGIGVPLNQLDKDCDIICATKYSFY